MKNLLFALAMLSAPLFQAQNMVLTSFATGFTSPVEIVNAKDSRLFVVQQNGIIKILRQDGSVNSANFLNISTKILFGGERGLLGLAFHPDYATNGFFYVFYTNTAGNIVVARYTVSSNPDVAEKCLLNKSVELNYNFKYLNKKKHQNSLDIVLMLFIFNENPWILNCHRENPCFGFVPHHS